MKEALLEACMHTLLGVGTVFAMLIVMSLIIYCFRFIPVLQKKLADRKNPTAEAQKTAAAASVPVNTVPAAAKTDDTELVAVIAAVIAASEQIPLDSFVVRTIKRRV